MSTEFENNNTLSAANTLALDTEITGQLAAASDEDYYKVNMTTAGSLHIVADMPTPEHSFYNYFTLAIYDANNTLLAQQVSNSDNTFDVGVPSAGDYYVKVSSANEFDSGQYALTVSTLNNETETIPTTPEEVIINPKEGNSNYTNHFLLYTENLLTNDVSVDYYTSNGTAIAGEDFVSATGTLTIKAGENSGVIGVEIIGDNIIEEDETFFLNLVNPKGFSFSENLSVLSTSHTIVNDDLSERPLSNIIGVNDSSNEFI